MYTILGSKWEQETIDRRQGIEAFIVKYPSDFGKDMPFGSQNHGWGCGYIALPHWHSLNGVIMFDKRMPNFDVNGGVTFARKVTDGRWCIGFDTNHIHDNICFNNKNTVIDDTLGMLDLLVDLWWSDFDRYAKELLSECEKNPKTFDIKKLKSSITDIKKGVATDEIKQMFWVSYNIFVGNLQK